MNFIIYKVVNQHNNKVYVGQTNKTLEKRKRHHSYSANTKNSPFAFHRAIRKYGLDGFYWEVIDTCNDKATADILEQQYIQQFNSINCGYNMTKGGGGIVGFRHSDLTKKKMSVAQQGINSHAFGKVGYRRGITMSREQKIKISRALGTKTILVFIVDSNECVGEWLTQAECARALCLMQQKISACLCGRRRSHRGYSFKYKD